MMHNEGMINQHPIITRTPLPASAWGPDAARVDALETMTSMPPGLNPLVPPMRLPDTCPHCLTRPANLDQHLRFSCPVIR